MKKIFLDAILLIELKICVGLVLLISSTRLYLVVTDYIEQKLTIVYVFISMTIGIL